ncbi:MAG: pitrilysin family protein [Bacteroidales bacterium]
MKQPKIQPFDLKNFDFSQLIASKQCLTNNLPIYMFSGGTQEVVRLEFIFEAGAYYQDKKLLAQAVCSLLTEGTLRFTADEISEKLDYYGAYIEKYSDRDQSSLVIYCLSKYIVKVIEIFEEIIKYPIFPQKELDIYLTKQKQKFKIAEQKVGEVSRKAFFHLVYGDTHPYGSSIQINDFDLLTRADLVRFHKAQYNSVNCKVVIAGLYDANLLEILQKYFGGSDWNGTPSILPTQIDWHASVDKKQALSLKGAMQASIRMGKPVPLPSNSDLAEFRIVNYILGGYFGSRLMKNIREEKGYTYGISSYLIPLRYSNTWMISSEVKADTLHLVEDEIYAEMEKLASKEVSERELEVVRSCYCGEMLRDMDGIFDLAEKMKYHLLYNLDVNYYTDFLQCLMYITPERIQAVAKQYFVKESIFEVSVGK